MHYQRFASDTHETAMIEDLKTYLMKPFAFDVVLRVRAGSNLQAGEYFGNFTTLNNTDYRFGTLDCDQSFAVSFFHDGKLDEKERVSFQCAVLHTTSTGQRRIRVMNLQVPVATSLPVIFRMSDLDAILHFSIKRALHQAPTASLSSLMTYVQVKSAQSLASYRKSCSPNTPVSQLLLPDGLKLLPLYCLALSKSIPFAPPGMEFSFSSILY